MRTKRRTGRGIASRLCQLTVLLLLLPRGLAGVLPELALFPIEDRGTVRSNIGKGRSSPVGNGGGERAEEGRGGRGRRTEKASREHDVPIGASCNGLREGSPRMSPDKQHRDGRSCRSTPHQLSPAVRLLHSRRSWGEVNGLEGADS